MGGLVLCVCLGASGFRNAGEHTANVGDTANIINEAVGTCGQAPLLGGAALDETIKQTSGILIVAIPQMRCTEAVKGALQSKGMQYTMKEFSAPFQYAAGASDVWDWLHCSYPNDATPAGMIMHSYVFTGGQFQGEGFAAAEKVQQGLLTGPSGGTTCEEQFPDEAEVVKQYQENSSNKVLLFGWLSCPCTSIAQTRFAANSVCFEGRTWANPSSKLMAYLQCKEGQPEDHSFVYIRNANQAWEFEGNGFMFDDSAMADEKFQSLVTKSLASTACKTANVKVNVYGTALQECRSNPADMAGSWQDDGTCSEQMGGIHEICIEHLPADFSSETHQSAWSQQRADQRHCVCIGAWSLYMSDAKKHPENAAKIMPHCSAIPETALTSRYLHNWKDWNGYSANVVDGVGKLVERCLNQVSDTKLQCGLRKRFDDLSNKVPDLKDADSLQELQARLQQLSC